jgi:hypothetical protein
VSLAMTFHACFSPAPTQVKPQPAPGILSQESVHTTLSITHHTRKRPSTGPRTTLVLRFAWLLCIWMRVSINKKQEKRGVTDVPTKSQCETSQLPCWLALPFLFSLSRLQLQCLFWPDGIQSKHRWWPFAHFTQVWRLVPSSGSADCKSAIFNYKKIPSVIYSLMISGWQY